MRDLGCARIPAVGVAVEVVEEGADEVFHAVAGGVVEGRVAPLVGGVHLTALGQQDFWKKSRCSMQHCDLLL